MLKRRRTCWDYFAICIIEARSCMRRYLEIRMLSKKHSGIGLVDYMSSIEEYKKPALRVNPQIGHLCAKKLFNPILV